MALLFCSSWWATCKDKHLSYWSTNPHESEQVGKVTVEQTTERISYQDDSKLNSIVQNKKIPKTNPVEDDEKEDEEADLGGSDELISGGNDVPESSEYRLAVF